jgi:tetratricopeptide (TPR) repeat protein
MGYEGLAKAYKGEKREDEWLATLNEYLNKGQDYGLQDSLVQEEIAQYYMHKKDIKSAIPYADAAAETASALGLFCASDAHTLNGDWDQAEQLLTDEMDHYSESPFRWYRWCSRTGHGNLSTARGKFEGYVLQLGARHTSEDLIEVGSAQLGEGNLIGALATFKQRLSEGPGPISELYIALIDDELHDGKGRDEALAKVPSIVNRFSPEARFAGLVQNALKSNPPAMLDAKALEAIIGDSPRAVDKVSIWALAGRYCLDHGFVPQGVEYLKKCVTAEDFYPERFWVDAALRTQGFEPWTIDPWRVNP